MRSNFLVTCVLAGIALAPLPYQPALAADLAQNPDSRDTLLPLSSLTGDKALDALMERLEVCLANTLV